MDQQAEDASENTNITPEELQRILDRASAEDVPTLVTLLQLTSQVLATQEEAIKLYGSLIVKMHDVQDTHTEILSTLNDRDYAVREALYFLREFRERERQTQGRQQPNINRT
jgi:hypothetical protein